MNMNTLVSSPVAIELAPLSGAGRIATPEDQRDALAREMQSLIKAAAGGGVRKKMAVRAEDLLLEVLDATADYDPVTDSLSWLGMSWSLQDLVSGDSTKASYVAARRWLRLEPTPVAKVQWAFSEGASEHLSVADADCLVERGFVLPPRAEIVPSQVEQLVARA
jgi:hypothetical protein